MNKFKYLNISNNKQIRYVSNTQKKKLYIVFLHGFMSNIEGEKPRAIFEYTKKNKLGFLALEYSGHGKSTGKFISNKEFELLPLIFREQGSATRKKMEYFLTTNKVSTYKKMELKSNEALKQAIVAGLGYSIMPLIGIKNELKNGDLQVIPVKKLPMKTEWNLIWLKSKNLSSIAKSFIENINENKNEIMNIHFNWFDEYL